MKSNKYKAIYTASRRAFADQFSVVWDKTPFKNDIDNLCYFRSLTCWYSSNHADIEDRRELLYRYAEAHFDTDDAQSTLNELYQALPTKSGAKRILSNLCGLYNKAARRSFGLSRSADIAKSVYERSDIDTALKTAHRYARLTNNACILPEIATDGSVTFKVLPPDLYRVKTFADKPFEVEELWIPVTLRGGKTFFNVWTSEAKEVRNHEGEITTIEPHSYGRIPAVFVQLENDMTDIYGGGMTQLVDAELDNNFLKFLVDNNVVYSGFSVWVATNFNSTKLRLSPNKMLTINGAMLGEGNELPPSLETVSPPPTFEGIADLQEKRYQNALREMGLPAIVYSADAKAESGYALFMQRQELIEIRSEDEPVLRRAERKLYELVSQMQEINKGVILPPVEDFTVDYQEQSIQLEPKENFELKRTQFEYGILSAVSFVKEMSGIDNLSTDDEAIEYIRKNRETYNALGGQAPTEQIISPQIIEGTTNVTN